MRKLSLLARWFFLTLGVFFLALGVLIRIPGLSFSWLPSVNAEVQPPSQPWDEFDPYLVSVSLPPSPGQTNLPDSYDNSVLRNVVASATEGEAQYFIPERIVIPAIELDAPILLTGGKRYNIRGKIYEQWIVPDTFAAGWNPISARPGEPGNLVLFGHHNVNGAVFARLHLLQSGDEISIFAGGQEHRYRVDEVLKLKEKNVGFDQMVENARWIAPTQEERLTLVTCWPPYESTYRLIVTAKPIS